MQTYFCNPDSQRGHRNFLSIQQQGVHNATLLLPTAHSLDAAVVIPHREVGFCAIIYKLSLWTGKVTFIRQDHCICSIFITKRYTDRKN